MSVPFSTTRIVDYWTSYPFSDFGDTTTKIYKMRCVVDEDSYTTLAIGTGTLTDAASAGVYALPASFVDATARFCSDSEPTSLSGGVIEFVRTFANIPQSRTDYSSGIKTYPPEFGYVREPTLYSLDESGPVPSRTRKYEYVKKPSRSETIAIRLSYSYVTTPGTLLTEEGFEVTKSDASYYSTTFNGYPVFETNEGTSTVTSTGTAGVIISTTIRQWMGDIYEKVTGYEI